MVELISKMANISLLGMEMVIGLFQTYNIVSEGSRSSVKEIFKFDRFFNFYFFRSIQVLLSHSKLFSTVFGSEGEQSIFSVYILNLFV